MNVNNELKAYHSSNPRVEVVWAPQPGSQEAFLSCPHDEVLYEGNRGPGKSQGYSALILAQGGWTTMGELSVGSLVTTPGGSFTEVTHIFEKGVRDLYKVTLSSGRSASACLEHLWPATWEDQGSAPGWKTSTLQLMQLLNQGRKPHLKAVMKCGPDSCCPCYQEEIVSIEFSHREQTRCIRVAHRDHEYVTDDYIVTHNTDALLMDYLQDVGKGYGEDWNGILFRRTFPELQDVIKKSLKWFRKIFPDAKYNAAKHVWTFRGGEKLTFAFMSVVADYDQYHGHEYPWIAWEELTNWATLDCYLKMMSTSRTSNPNIRRRIRATCNPSGIGHNVVKARWQLPNAGGKMVGKAMQDEPDEDTEPGTEMPVRVAIHGDLSENKILLHANPNYRNTIAVSATSEAQRRAWLYGDWEITSGGMFDDIWKKEYHVIPTMDPRTFPAGWKLDRSYDHGQSRPFSVGFWAESNGEPLHVPGYGMVGQVPGDLIRFSEWYGFTGEANKGIRMAARDIGKGVRERVRDFGVRIQPGVADSSIFDQWEPDKTVAGQMRRVGIRWLKADKSAGSRKQGWQEIRERLKGAIPDETGYREQKGLFVMENCVQFIRTVPVLPRDDRDMDDVDTEAEDHIGDEVRYRCRAKGPKVMTVRKG